MALAVAPEEDLGERGSKVLSRRDPAKVRDPAPARETTQAREPTKMTEPTGVLTAAEARAELAELYAAHAGAVLRFLRDLLGDPTLAADATQETFARAFRRLETVREGARKVGWLFGIARHVSLEYMKLRRTARGRFSDDAELSNAPCGRSSPEAHLLGLEAAARLSRALSELSEERRAALLLRVDHGLSYEEVASALGISVAKARVEVFRAREALRERLAEDGGAL